jgi:four helix bundle protein
LRIESGEWRRISFVTKSYAFALDVVKVCKQLYTQKEFVLSKQLLRSGTSIGANVQEATQAQCKADFIHKMSIALKECVESIYWLRLLVDSDSLSQEIGKTMLGKAEELKRIITSIVKTSKERP